MAGLQGTPFAVAALNHVRDNILSERKFVHDARQ